MRTRSTPAGHARGDRLERLLGGVEEGPGPVVEDVGEPADGPPELSAEQRAGSCQDQLPREAAGRTEADEGLFPDDRPSGGRHREGRVPLLSVPESLRSSELGVGARAVRGLLALAVAATLVLGGRWLWTERVALASPSERVVPVGAGTGEVVEADAAEGAAGTTGTGADGNGGTDADGGTGAHGIDTGGTGADGTGTGGTGAGGPPQVTPKDLVVHVAGEVADPGVVTLPDGSRVVDALRAAGGLTPRADETTLNLARPLVDGERVWVGRPGEEPPVVAGAAPAGGWSGAGDPTGAAAAPVDLNAATQADLEELPGVGPVTAGHILAWRQEHGRFSSVDELLEVSGIGERTLAQLAPLVTVGG